MKIVAASLFALMVAGSVLAVPPASQPAANEKRELLAENSTVAKFTGIAYQQCRGMTALCPDKCGQSGDFASFQIVSYLVYRKLGQYGDPKATTYVFQVEDNHKNLKVPKELAAEVRGLKPGDYVLLDWRHDYVTTFEAGGSSSSPERPITKLQKISKDEADRLVKQKPPASSQPATTSQPDIAKVITDLSSDDGRVRVAATKAIFALGKDALDPLAKAGAKQVTPLGPATGRRIDIVYSLLDGLRPNPVNLPRGYHAGEFKLIVEKDCTVEDVKKMGERQGFTIPQNFALNSHAFLGRGKNLAETITAILTSEPQVITVDPEFFRLMP